MQAFKCNLTRKDKEIECPVCKEEEDTTEHTFQCKVMKRILGNEEMRWRDVESENINQSVEESQQIYRTSKRNKRATIKKLKKKTNKNKNRCQMSLQHGLHGLLGLHQEWCPLRRRSSNRITIESQ